MAKTDSKSVIRNSLAALPTPEEIRTRIAENHQERYMLRQLLKLSEQRRALANVGRQEIARSAR